jgi:AcrR family transcriptional regulator
MANDSTRARILEAAGAVFAEHGYEAATVREICENAGVNLAAVNYYFGSKERLYVETLEHAHACGAQQRDLPDWPPGTQPQVKLKHFIRQLLTNLLSVKGEPWDVRLLTREFISPTPVGKKLLGERVRKGFGQLQGILSEIVPADMPDHKRHQIAFSIIGQCVYYRAAGKIIPLVIAEHELQEHYGIDQLAEHVCEVCLAALGLGPPLLGPHGQEAGPAQIDAAVIDPAVDPAHNPTRALL